MLFSLDVADRNHVIHLLESPNTTNKLVELMQVWTQTLFTPFKQTENIVESKPVRCHEQQVWSEDERRLLFLQNVFTKSNDFFCFLNEIELKGFTGLQQHWHLQVSIISSYKLIILIS